jgi:hypothetical protein
MSLLMALFGSAVLSDLGPECTPKRKSVGDVPVRLAQGLTPFPCSLTREWAFEVTAPRWCGGRCHLARMVCDGYERCGRNGGHSPPGTPAIPHDVGDSTMPTRLSATGPGLQWRSAGLLRTTASAISGFSAGPSATLPQAVTSFLVFGCRQCSSLRPARSTSCRHWR